MVRVPTERDVGIDAFVQVTDDNGIATGEVFAVQVKSGESYRRTSGFAVPVDQHGDAWRSASVPVIVVVLDPRDGSMWWNNATEVLQVHPDLSMITVQLMLPSSNENPLHLLRSIRLSADFRGGLPRGLGGVDVNDQIGAVWQCFALGFQSPNGLIALRRLFLSLHSVAAREAIFALSHCIYHPDIFYTPNNLLPSETRSTVAATMRWNTSETCSLLGLIDENGIARGSIGQCIVLLILEDVDHMKLLREVAIKQDVTDTSGWAAYMVVASVDEQQQPLEWSALLDLQPRLRETFAYEFISEGLRKFGYVTME